MNDKERLLLARKVATAIRNPNWGSQTTLDDARIAVDVVLAVAAPVIARAERERLATVALDEARQERIRDGVDPDGFTHEGLFIPAKGGTAFTRYEIADWIRAQGGGEGDPEPVVPDEETMAKWLHVYHRAFEVEPPCQFCRIQARNVLIQWAERQALSARRDVRNG